MILLEQPHSMAIYDCFRPAEWPVLIAGLTARIAGFVNPLLVLSSLTSAGPGGENSLLDLNQQSKSVGVSTISPNLHPRSSEGDVE